MRPDRLTNHAQEAIASAQRIASASRNTEVAPAHLLLALLEQENGLATSALQRLSIDTGATAADTREAIAGLAALSGDASPELRPSQTLIRVLERAEREMSKRGDEYITVGHLLLAL
ncbi:MAG: Clp protease N-terminal domain-containing protein, partial [Solirubrobacterales bacterium]